MTQTLKYCGIDLHMEEASLKWGFGEGITIAEMDVMDRRLPCPCKKKQPLRWAYGSPAAAANRFSVRGWNTEEKHSQRVFRYASGREQPHEHMKLNETLGPSKSILSNQTGHATLLLPDKQNKPWNGSFCDCFVMSRASCVVETKHWFSTPCQSLLSNVLWRLIDLLLHSHNTPVLTPRLSTCESPSSLIHGWRTFSNCCI